MSAVGRRLLLDGILLFDELGTIGGHLGLGLLKRLRDGIRGMSTSSITSSLLLPIAEVGEDND